MMTLNETFFIYLTSPQQELPYAFGGDRALLGDVFAHQDHGNGLDEDLHVFGEAYVLDVFQVMLYLLIPGNGITPTDLGVSCETWSHTVSEPLSWIHEIDILKRLWAWSYDRHRTFED